MALPDPAQWRLLRYIARHTRRTGSAPSCQEIAEAMGWPTFHAVVHSLAELEQGGWLPTPGAGGGKHPPRLLVAGGVMRAGGERLMGPL